MPMISVSEITSLGAKRLCVTCHASVLKFVTNHFLCCYLEDRIKSTNKQKIITQGVQGDSLDCKAINRKLRIFQVIVRRNHSANLELHCSQNIMSEKKWTATFGSY